MLTKKDKQEKKKENAEGDDESLDMNVFENSWKVSTQRLWKSDDDFKIINDTNTFAYSKQNNMNDKSCEGNNYNNDYDKLAYPFSKIIKLKHEPEEAQQNNPGQYRV
jgi:hypothetical protein